MSSQKDEVSIVIEKLFRTQYGKMISYLTSKFGFDFLENAEDIAQETLSTAYQKWAFDGIPENPEAWIFVVARNKAYNLLKKNKKTTGTDLSRLIQEFTENENQIFLNRSIEDGMLRIMIVCCNLKLPVESKMLFILSCLCGFSRKELSNALLIKEETVKKRLFRAKKAIRAQQLNLGDVQSSSLQKHVHIIANILYILFNKGYNSSNTKSIIRKDVCFEAMRLTKLLLEHLNNEPQIHALFALMCFHTARFESRIDEKGAIVLFKDQNRKRWNKKLIDSGIYHLSKASHGNILSTFHLEAAIAAEHCTASNFNETNWKLIVKLYKHLYSLKPSPIIMLNLAIVNAMLGKIEIAIDELYKLKNHPKLKDNYLVYATIGELLGNHGKYTLAIKAFEEALCLTPSEMEKELLLKKRGKMLEKLRANNN